MNALPEKQNIIRINCVIEGDPARWLIELKRRKIVITNKEAVILGLQAIYEEILKLDSTELYLKDSKRK